MKYLPIHRRSQAWMSGGARLADDPRMVPTLKSVHLQRPGARLSFLAHGKHLGIVFTEHAWSGVVEISTMGTRRVLDLHRPEQRFRVVEIALPTSLIPVPVTIRLLHRAHPNTQAREAWVHAAYVTDCSLLEVPARLAARVERPPFDRARLNELTDPYKWYEPAWCAAQDAARAGVTDYRPPDYVHRKSWEWVQTVYGLDWLGMLRPQHRALGLGVGWEPLSYFFSNMVQDVLATDLYAVDDQWTDREGNPKILENPETFAPYEYRKDHVRFARMDGRHLETPDESFDFVWTCSSIEHFGGHEGSAAAMKEVERVLKPGGVACVITEYVLPDEHTGELSTFDPEYFNLRSVYEFLVRPVGQLRLVQALDLSFPDYYVRRAVRIPEESAAPHGVDKPHVVLRVPNGCLITSIAMFLRKEGGRRLPPGSIVTSETSARAAAQTLAPAMS